MIANLTNTYRMQHHANSPICALLKIYVTMSYLSRTDHDCTIILIILFVIKSIVNDNLLIRNSTFTNDILITGRVLNLRYYISDSKYAYLKYLTELARSCTMMY